jgi:hypothetical protein
MARKRPGDHASRRSLRGAAAAALASSITLAAACDTSATHTATGTALVRGNIWTFGLAPIRPGSQLGLLYASLTNKSRSPLAINSVTLAGRGVGTVIKLVEVKIAPNETGRKGTPGGAFEVYPPTSYWTPTGTCNQQVLVALPGFRLAPGGEARVWFRIQGARPGTFHVKGDVVHYLQDGVSYRQFIPTGYKGSVSRRAPFIPIDPQQARCMKSEHARPLKGHYLTKPKNYD